AYVNLPRLGAGPLRLTTGWSIGAWFVPILNWIRPKQIVNDIWRTTAPERPTGVQTAPDVSPLVHWWWGLWVSVGWLVGIGASTAAGGWRSTGQSGVSETQ